MIDFCLVNNRVLLLFIPQMRDSLSISQKPEAGSQNFKDGNPYFKMVKNYYKTDKLSDF